MLYYTKTLTINTYNDNLTLIFLYDFDKIQTLIIKQL